MSQPQPKPGYNPPRHPAELEYSNDKNSLLLNEPFNQVQPGLKIIFGSEEAEILQQIVIWRNHPYEDRMLDKKIELKQFLSRWWARIPPEMMTNPWSGKVRHIGKRGVKEKVGSIRKQGAIWTANLNEKSGSNVNWYTVIDEVVNPLTGIYQELWNQTMQERWEANGFGEILGEAREQELFEELTRRLDEERERLRGLELLPGKHFTWEEVQPLRRAEREGRGRTKIVPPPTEIENLHPKVEQNLSGVGQELSHIPDEISPIYGSENGRILYKESKESKEDHQQHHAAGSREMPSELDDDVEFSSSSDFDSGESQIGFAPVSQIIGGLPIGNNVDQTASSQISPAARGQRDNYAKQDDQAARDEELLSRLTVREHGINRKSAEKLLDDCGALRIEDQLQYWNDRPEVQSGDFTKSRGAFFSACVRNDYPPPPAYEKRKAAEEAADRARLEEERRQRERETSRQVKQQQDEALEADNKRLDTVWEKLDQRTKDRLEKDAIERLGVLGRLGNSQGAIAAMRRTVLREMLGQAQSESQPVEQEARVAAGGE